MINLFHVVEVVIGFTIGYTLSRLFFGRIENILVDLYYKVRDYFDDSPHITDDMYDEALSKIMKSPDFPDIARSGDIFKICPKCRSFKRSFYKEGRKRICMDCEFNV